jgi:hypothetical protein
MKVFSALAFASLISSALSAGIVLPKPGYTTAIGATFPFVFDPHPDDPKPTNGTLFWRTSSVVVQLDSLSS